MSDEGLYNLEDAWRLAMQREQDALDFYTKMARGASDAAVKALFTELADQEAEHKARLVREYRRVFETGGEDEEAGAAHRHPRDDGEGPVAWMEWSEDAFRLAEELDLPVLLDISAVWCHWCHVMDERTYSDPEVASLINAEFIPIRVDNDRRPDINARYNMGGWPTTSILAPNGEVLTGRTYVPPEDMVRLLQQVSQYYRENRGELERRLEKTEGLRREHSSRAQAAGPVSLDIVDEVARTLLENFDRVHGGFGDAPKFPHPDALELALAVYHRTGDRQMRRLVELTLTNMAAGGVFDHEMGGFFRYATTRDWMVPHFEKMAEDNARLLRVYLHAYQVFGYEVYRQTAERILEYVNSTLYNHTMGYFYGSQDADEDYYNLSREEREQREAPFIDKTLYVNWNAMMAVAYFEAAVVLGETEYARQAERVLDTVWDSAYAKDMGMFHYVDRLPHVPGLLTDQIWMARALLTGYQYVGRADFLQQAMVLMDESVYVHYVDPNGLGYFDCVVDPGAPGRLKDGIKNIDENALVAEVSTMLYRLTGQERYRDAINSALGAFGAGYRGYRYFASAYALAVNMALRPYVSIVVVGDDGDERTGALLRAALGVYVPNRLVQTFDPAWQGDQLEALGLAAEPTPAVYVCQGDVCAEPVADPAQVAAAIAKVTLMH